MNDKISLDTLKHLIQTASWFSNLGQVLPQQKSIIDICAEQWKQIFTFSIEAEFGLPYDAAILETIPYPLLDFDWLPTSSYGTDPVLDKRLAEQVQGEGKGNTFKADRLEISRLTLRAVREAAEHPLLIVGSSDLRGCARGAAVTACRLAATEIMLEQPGFWCDIVLLYHAGHWPFGKAKSGETLVL